MTQAQTQGHYLDLPSWNRAQHFEIFRDFANPFFSVCVDVDATVTWEACHGADSPSFNIATLFLFLRAANETEAFRRRIRGDLVWVHDSVGTSTTVLRDDETFGFAILFPSPTFAEFEPSALKEVQRAKRAGSVTVPQSGEDHLVYHSTLPWFRFTSFTNALGGTDSVPRVVFGKCSAAGNRWLMPVAIEVHHALVDGLDVARFLERFQQGLSDSSALSPRAT